MTLKLCGQRFTLFREKAGIISKEAVWVLRHDEFMYVHETRRGLFWCVVTEWRDPKHMVTF